MDFKEPQKVNGIRQEEVSTQFNKQLKEFHGELVRWAVVNDHNQRTRYS